MLVEMKGMVMIWRWVWGILRKPGGSCRMSGVHFGIFIGGWFCQLLETVFEQDGNMQVKDE